MSKKMTNRELAHLTEQLISLQSEAALIADQIDELKDKIKSEMASRDIEEFNSLGVIITNKGYFSSRFNTKDFRRDHPDLAEAYTDETFVRRFSASFA